MRDDQEGLSGLPDSCEKMTHQCVNHLRAETAGRLVEQDERFGTCYGKSREQTVALAARKAGCIFAERRIDALRQLVYHWQQLGIGQGGKHGLFTESWTVAYEVLADGGGE